MKDLNILKVGYVKGFRHIFHNIKQFFKNCKYAWQRATKGYSDWDTWSLGTYYSDIISNSMTQFANETNSYPCGMTYDEWVEKIRSIAHKIKASNDYEDKYWEEISLLSDLELERPECVNKHLKEEKEANKITAEGYKKLADIIYLLWL